MGNGEWLMGNGESAPEPVEGGKGQNGESVPEPVEGELVEGGQGVRGKTGNGERGFGA